MPNFLTTRKPKTYLIFYPSLGNSTTYITITLHLAAFHGRLSSAQWLVGHGIHPQAVNEGKDTAKDIAEKKKKTKVVDFLDKVDSLIGLFFFPLKYFMVSPLNFFALTDDSDGLKKHISAENQTANYDANQEVITSFILK